MEAKNKLINKILLCFSTTLLLLDIFLKAPNIISWYFFAGIIFGVLISWIYTLTSMYSTKLIFKTENPFLQLGFSVLKIGILFFTTYLIVWGFGNKYLVYGILIGFLQIIVYYFASSFVYLKFKE